MSQALSEILSPAVGVMISPFPIVGLILILLSARARTNSLFYLLGWMLGNAAVFVIAMLFMGAGLGAQGDPSPARRIVFLALGVLILLLAAREFAKRPRGNEKPKTPRWFERMSRIGPAAALGFGAFLSALNPKNALLALSAGASVGALDLTAAQNAALTAIFVAIASLLILLPTVAFWLSGTRLNRALDAMRGWLIHNNAVIMSVLLLMIGLNVIGKAF